MGSALKHVAAAPGCTDYTDTFQRPSPTYIAACAARAAVELSKLSSTQPCSQQAAQQSTATPGLAPAGVLLQHDTTNQAWMWPG
jgi:hypothetical protein